MKRLVHIFILALALAGLMAPGLRAESHSGHCARAIWAQSQSVAGLPAPVKISGLAAPLRLAACPDLAILVEPLPAVLAPRQMPPPQALSSPLPLLVWEAELPPPRRS